MPDVASLQSIRRTATDLLGTGTLTLGDLIAGLRGAGLGLGPDAVDTVMQALDGDGRFWELEGERWVSVPNQLEGTTWTTTVPGTLPADDAIAVEPDFTLLGWWAVETPIPLADPPDGALELVELDDGSNAFLGPPDWLDGTGAVALAVAGGTVALSRPDRPPEVSPEQAGAVRAAFDAGADRDELASGFGPDEPVELVTMHVEELLWESVVAGRDAFVARPVAPVDDLLAAAGLERRDFTIAPAGTDWLPYLRWQRRRRIGARYDLDDDGLDAVEALLGASHAVIGGDDDPLGPPAEETNAALFLAVCLALPDVCRAFVGVHAERETEPDELAGFARRLLAHVDDPAATGPRWLLARALTHQGDALAARAELEVAAAAGLDHPLVLRDLAAFHADAGDAPGAVALLRRAGLDTVADDADEDDEDAYDPLFVEVVPFAVRPRPSARRNDRCPCGSGRKYKDCHLGREQRPLLERGAWLFRKARRYLHDGRYRGLGAALAETMVAVSGRGYLLLRDLLESEIVDDVALCEGGVFDDFVTERDAILPDDEALLAGRWALVERSLFEVESIDGDALGLRDLRSGDRIVVTNTRAYETTRPGHLLLGRPLPIEETWRAYSGFVHVGDVARDRTLEALDTGDAFEIAAAIGATYAPPTMQNTDGEKLAFHELTFRVDDADAAARALAGSTLHDNGDGHFTLVRDSANQPDTVILSLQLTATELSVSTNSDRRADEARELVASLLPGAVLEDDDVRSLDEMLAAPSEPTEELGPDDHPELASMLDGVIREREQRWVDEPVPLLRGLTPREAADDPVAREDLLRLLRGMDDRPRGQGGFDPDRLRTLLGIAPGE